MRAISTNSKLASSLMIPTDHGPRLLRKLSWTPRLKQLSATKVQSNTSESCLTTTSKCILLHIGLGCLLCTSIPCNHTLWFSDSKAFGIYFVHHGMIKGRLLVSPGGLGTCGMQSIGLVELAWHGLGQYGVCNCWSLLYSSSRRREVRLSPEQSSTFLTRENTILSHFHSAGLACSAQTVVY